QVILLNHQYFTHLLKTNKVKNKHTATKTPIKEIKPATKTPIKEIKPATKVIKPANNEKILVYMGPAGDMRPLGSRAFEKINRFVFIDGLPKLKHYQPSSSAYHKYKDRPSLVNTLKTGARNYGYNLVSGEDKGNLLVFKRGNKVLEYYMNTLIQDAVKMKKFKDIFKKALFVYESGFEPRHFGFKDSMTPKILTKKQSELLKLMS
ncbi:hypothetical protein ACROYT_G001819, partial [Oculina patagonica]